MRLLYANRDADSVIFARRPRALPAAHADRLEVRHHLDAPAASSTPTPSTAFPGADLDADLYICGPTPFMDLVESTALDAGIDPDPHRHRALRQVADAIADEPRPSDAAADGDGEPAEITIILKGKRTTVAYQPGDTMLETARRGGLVTPFSCEAGNCATCMALLHEGEVTMRANNALDPDEVEEGWVLTCQAVPDQGPLTVEYEAL